MKMFRTSFSQEIYDFFSFPVILFPETFWQPSYYFYLKKSQESKTQDLISGDILS